MERRPGPLLILDANILIDFCKCDKTIVKLICNHVGQIFLASPVLAEINEIDEPECLELGINVVEPDLEIAIMAAEQKGPLSFQDNLCLLMAQKHGGTCVTNDKPLRRRCEREGVPLFWGIELICILVESGGLPAEQAKVIILEIHNLNPKYVTGSIVADAFRRLGIKRK